jgi:ABC-type transport system involved in cytochrome bd biosynthesis fused ATPase/permease subunit
VPCRLLLLDEPAASLDAHSEQRVMQALTHASRSKPRCWLPISWRDWPTGMPSG